MGAKCLVCDKSLHFWSPDYTKFKNNTYLCEECKAKYKVFDGCNWEDIRAYIETLSPSDAKKLITNPNQLNQVKSKINKETNEAVQQYKAQQKKIQAAEDKYQNELNDFKKNGIKCSRFYYRLDTKQIFVARTLLSNESRLINFDEIISYKVNERGHNKNKKHGITRAVVGGALAGGVGAIVGATTGGNNKEYIDHLGLIINLSDGSNIEIPFLNGGEKADGWIAKAAYKSMNDLISSIEANMVKTQQQKQSNNPDLSSSKDIPTQIKEYKELADEGIISQEEFDAKKKQLLNL